jgi:signal transduction histidine kinase
LSTFVGAVLIGAVLASEASPWPVAAWIAAYMWPALQRIRLSRGILREQVAPDEAALRQYFYLAIFNGAWTGALPMAFFAGLSIEARAALTVLSLLSLTAGAATFASYRRGYLWVLALALPPLVLNWLFLGRSHSWIIVITLLVFGGLMVKLSRHLADVFERSVEIRFERERVVEQLRYEKGQTELACQRAEEASRSKSRFLASASHDLRQPVHALGLFSGVLAATAETSQHHTIARNISAVSEILRKLLDNLLDISRLDAGIVSVAVQPASVAALVDRLAAETASVVAGRPIRIGASAADDWVVLDAVHVERCLRNLLDNACKFTLEGHVSLSATREGGQLVFRVSDSGVGIPPDQVHLVFEEFYQVGNIERNQSKGLGLGLSIVARLAALMGGEVHVDSTLGQGSSFSLHIPYVPACEASVPADDSRSPALDLTGHRVLVVDDEALVRAAMGAQLAAWGAQVDEADGFVQARTLHDAGPSDWKLCFCDLRLRDGEDGIRTAQRLRQEDPRLPVILITGDTAPSRIEQAARSGLPLLHKPVGPAQLARAIREAIGG